LSFDVWTQIEEGLEVWAKVVGRILETLVVGGHHESVTLQREFGVPRRTEAGPANPVESAVDV
jgi:hypothetical protein